MRHGFLRAAGKGVSVALFAALGLVSVGCSQAKTQCTVTSLKDQQCYEPGFKRAYASRDNAGDLNIVCAAEVKRAEKLTDSETASLRQIMHIRVLWQPGHGMNDDQPTATNAAIRWYVFNTDTANGGGMIEYAGTGLVEVDRDGELTTVEVRNATLNPVNARGLNDPIGPAKFKGTVVAHTDRARVSELLAEVKTGVASAASHRQSASQLAGTELAR